MMNLLESGRIAIGIVSVVSSILTGTPATHSTEGPSAGEPYACDKFFIRMANRDSGSAIEWFFDVSCHFGADGIEISVVTTENNVERDRFTIGGRTIKKTQLRRVPLVTKPRCTKSTVRVVASYSYMNLGDKKAIERVVTFDPLDNCGA